LYDGSGDDCAQALAGVGVRHSASPDVPDPKRAVDGALTITTELMRPEMLGTTNKSQGFGFAYELLCLVDGQHFEYVNNVLYYAIIWELDETGRYLGGGFHGPVYKYEAHGNLTAVYTFDPRTREHGFDEFVSQTIPFRSLLITLTPSY
jgi:hypothetical protein